MIEGVEYVHNSSTPLRPTKTVAFKEEFTLSEKDEAGEIRIFKPSRYAVDAQDRIYVCDDSDLSVKVFDSQGKFLRSFGRKGSGPGEFETIRDMVFSPDGRLLVTDDWQRRTSFFSSDGQFLSSFQWKKNYSSVHIVTNSSLTAEESVFLSDGKFERRVKVLDFAGDELLNFGKFTSPEMKMLVQSGGATAYPVPWSPFSIFAGDQRRQLLYHCLNDKYIIEVFDQKGRKFRQIDRPYEPVPVTGKDIKKLRSRFAASSTHPIAILLRQMEFPKVKTVTERLLVDDAGNLWVQTNEEKKQAEKTLTAYDIFNPDGVYEARVWLDSAPGLFAGGKMYRTVEDTETGLRLPKRYRIMWKQN